MIVPMSKVYVVTQSRNRDSLLDVLGELGVVHIEPVHPDQAVADESTIDKLDEFKQAIRILQSVQPVSGTMEAADPQHLAQETILLQKTLIEEREQLNSLQRQASQLSLWGNTRIKDLEYLRDANIPLQFYQLPQALVAEQKVECIEVVADLPGQQVVVAVIDRVKIWSPPDEATLIRWPARDLPTLKQEAAVLDNSIQENSARLSLLAQHIEDLERARRAQEDEASLCVAERSGIAHSTLYALQGWIPSDQAMDLGQRLSDLNCPSAVEVVKAETNEEPPTLIEYPGWAKPIKALFDMLGTLPGYDEIDLSPFFMVCLPLFAAMLIGDAGYGLVLLVAGTLFYSKIVKGAGKPSAHLLLIFGVATLIWGTLTANYFGVTPPALQPSLVKGDAPEGIAKTMISLAPLWRLDAEAGRNLIMKISLLIGCIHLVTAHIRRVVELFPDVRAYAEIAWAVILVDMLAIIWFMMFPETGSMPGFLGVILLLGVIAVSWFGEPQPNPVKRVFTGFAAAILPLLSTFSDIMSYIRLFAVGLASYYIAEAFNGLGAQVANSATWIAGAPIVIFGHVLNLGLAAIAIFAHGVRLNMLEFSNNVGVKWAGYAYRPFTK
jgi:V/A-type H+-transporting ATPase subunit I